MLLFDRTHVIKSRTEMHPRDERSLLAKKLVSAATEAKSPPGLYAMSL